MAALPSAPAASGERREGQSWGRWLPAALVAGLAGISTVSLLVLQPAEAPGLDPWWLLWGCLFGVALTGAWRRLPARRLRPVSVPRIDAPGNRSGDGATVSMLGALTGQTYWEQDANGYYTSIVAPGANPFSPMHCLLKTRRGDLAGDWLEPTSCHHLDNLLGRHKTFRTIVWSRTLASGETLTFEESGHPRFSPDGRFTGYHGVIREVSSRGAAGQPDRAMVNALSANPVPAVLLHAAPRGHAHHRHWTVQTVNPALIALSGHAASAIRQLPVDHWLKTADDAENSVAELLNDETNHRQPAILVNHFGEQHPVQLTINKIQQTPTGTSTIVFVDHLTPGLAHARRETLRLEALRETDAQQALALQVAARELESFSHTVSHDLGAPIRHVIGFAQVLREQYGGLLDRVGNDTLERISAAGHRMDSMLNALVDLHRISTTPVAADRLNLSSIAVSVAGEIEQQYPAGTVSFEIKDNLVCQGDHTLMRMVLWNLLNNAAKFSSKVTAPHVAFDAYVEDDRTIYTVIDNGVGFNPEAADRLFRPFARLHSSADFPGTGIGLATVQRIIRRHGGQIWAESVPGSGARFLFTLWDQSRQ